MIDRDKEGMFLQGNKVALKYSDEDILEILEGMSKYIESNDEEYTISGALLKCGVSRMWLKRAKERDNESVRYAIKKIDDQLEARIINNTLTGKAKSATMGIFLLKNRYGYEDKQKHDHTSKEEPLVFLKLGDREIRL